MKKGFIVLELMLIIWVGSLIGYGIHKGVIAVEVAPPPCEQVGK